MLNKLLILILKHKMQKLVYKNCGECAKLLGCDYYCDIYLKKRGIKIIINYLKERKI